MLKLGPIGPPHGHDEPTREAIRNRQLEQARRAGWTRLERADVVLRRWGIVEHRPTGELFRLHRGELTDAVYVNAVAYFEDGGQVVFLEEPPAGPKTVDELQQRRARRTPR